MAYYDALKAIWSSLSGTTDAKLAALNAMTVAGPNAPVDVVTATNYMRQNGTWYAIKAAAGSNQAAFAAVDLVNDLRVQTIDFSLPIVVQMGAMLVSANLMTQAQWDGLMALSKTTIPWWQSVGLNSPVGIGDLEATGLS